LSRALFLGLSGLMLAAPPIGGNPLPSVQAVPVRRDITNRRGEAAGAVLGLEKLACAACSFHRSLALFKVGLKLKLK
jgi:hypothetical protein